jgi:hypothetical protein
MKVKLNWKFEFGIKKKNNRKEKRKKKENRKPPIGPDSPHLAHLH